MLGEDLCKQGALSREEEIRDTRFKRGSLQLPGLQSPACHSRLHFSHSTLVRRQVSCLQFKHPQDSIPVQETWRPKEGSAPRGGLSTCLPCPLARAFLCQLKLLPAQSIFSTGRCLCGMIKSARRLLICQDRCIELFQVPHFLIHLITDWPPVCTGRLGAARTSLLPVLCSEVKSLPSSRHPLAHPRTAQKVLHALTMTHRWSAEPHVQTCRTP